MIDSVEKNDSKVFSLSRKPSLENLELKQPAQLQ